MVRPRGARNAGFETRRTALLERLRERLQAEGPAPSLRELAAHAGVSVPTLQHYFGDRQGAVAAVLADHHVGGAAPEGPLAHLARPAGALADSVREALAYAAAGFRHGGLTAMHALGLAEGLRSGPLGTAYLAAALDPTLAALAARLAAHQARGELRAGVDPRHAALALLAPLVLAFLHQAALGGAATAPLDVDAFLEAHAAAFVHGYGSPAAAGRGTRPTSATDEAPHPRGDGHVPDERSRRR